MFLVVALLGSWCSWSCFLGFCSCFWFLLSSVLFGFLGHHYFPMLCWFSWLLLSWVVDVHGCILLGFVSVLDRALLGFVWCSWLCFPRALLLLLVMFSRAWLMFMVIALLGFVSVCGCCFFGLLVFVVIALLGFVGIGGHDFLDSWC